MNNEKIIFRTIVGGLLLGAFIALAIKFQARVLHKESAEDNASSPVSKNDGPKMPSLMTSAQAATPRSFPVGPNLAAGSLVNPPLTEEDGQEEESAQRQAIALAEQFRKPLNRTEVKSVTTFVQKMAKYAAPGFTPEMAFADLKKMGLQPEMAKASDPDTGSLVTIRTNSSLPGMRYIHLQFVGEENGATHLQSMTAEVRPGTDSMDVAKRAIHEQFNFRGAPANERADFAEWHRDPYTAWVKQLNTEEELMNNPFNARTVEDAGTTVLGYQVNPHTHDSDDHEHF